MHASAPLRVAIYDAQWALVELVRDFLSIEPGIEVVVATHSLAELPERWDGIDVLFFGLQGRSAADDDAHWLQSRLGAEPVPTLLAAPHTVPGAEVVVRSLLAGAEDFVLKTAFRQSHQLSQFGFDIARRVKAIAARPTPPREHGLRVVGSTPFRIAARSGPARRLIGITAPAGALGTLKKLLPRLPLDESGILLSMPFPSLYTMIAASHLERAAGIEVREAVDQHRIDPGRVLVAPGGFHLEVFPGNACYYARLNQRPPSPRPSADQLFESLAAVAGRASVGIRLVGSESEGATGIVAMKQAGALTIENVESVDEIIERILGRADLAQAA